jgi:hypothetical protein
VYRATLAADGQEVAVKVQRPGVATSIALDVYVLRLVRAAGAAGQAEAAVGKAVQNRQLGDAGRQSITYALHILAVQRTPLLGSRLRLHSPSCTHTHPPACLQWGKMEAATAPSPAVKPKMDNNLSLVEYELVPVSEGGSWGGC